MAQGREKYVVKVNGVKHVLMLDPADVKRYPGAVKVEEAPRSKGKPAPANKQAVPANKGSEEPAGK